MAGKRYLNANDYKLLVWLWRWKLVNVKMIIDKFYSDRSTSAALQQYYNIRKFGLINCHVCGMGKQMMVSLSEKGFKLICDGLPELEQKGFKSEHKVHDFLSSVFHGGGFGHELPDGIELITEQELRAINKYDLPDWVPDTSERRPDGFTRLRYGSEQKIFSHEVELSYKKIYRMKHIARYYNNTPSIDRVFWLVRKRIHGRTIEQHFSETKGIYREIHNFICLDEFAEKEWESVIFHGPDIHKTYKECLSTFGQLSIEKWASKVALNMSKTPYKSSGCVKFVRSHFS